MTDRPGTAAPSPARRPADRLHLSPRHRAQLEALLREHLPGVEVWAYGSRITGESHDGSDLDLVLRAPDLQKIPVGRLSDLWEALRESTIPFLVETRDWARLPEGFHGEIERDYVVLVDRHRNTKQVERANRQDPTERLPRRGWRRAKIEEIAEKVAMGPFGSSIKVETFTPTGVPIISGQHLHGSRVDDEPGFNFISDEHAERLRGANVRKGDVIFTHRGNIGQVAYVPKNAKYDRYVISQSQFYVRPDPSQAIPEFLTAYFKTAEGRHDLLANTAQVGVPSIAQPVTYLRTLDVPLPPVEEQRAIAHVLGALDDKIELNRRMNETLEAMARALFQSWFVDFDPVRAKREERDTGLPKEIADLFPDRLVNSELGDVPVGWEIKTLGDLLELAYGKALRADERNGGNVPVHGSNGRVGWHDQRLVQGPGIVVGRKGNPGTVTWVASDFFPIDTTFYVVPKHGSGDLFFMFHTLKNQNLASVATDSAVPGINRNLAYMNRAIVPSERIIEHFNQHMKPFFFRNHILQSEARKLTDLRDWLLPELIAGKLSATDVSTYRPVV